MIAKVAFPIAISGIFDYKIPKKFSTHISVGVPVRVELKNRRLWGVVLQITDKSKHPNLKKILDIKTEEWSESSKSLIGLYKWIASYYQCELGIVFKPLLRKRIADMRARNVDIYSFSGKMPPDLTKKQKSVAESLHNMDKELTKIELIEKYGISKNMISILTHKDVLIKGEREVLREADELDYQREDYKIVLTSEQNKAVETICSQSGKKLKVILLYGITGSGKTHVYIELVKRTLDIGKNIIILVPEISLTPQTIQRFMDAVGPRIAVIHSRMSDGERRDSVEELVSGRKRIAIGARSAILVPMTNIGLIIVDEEHDGSYKQSDSEPRYNARDIAVMRGYYQKSLVILGSATPSFESYYNALHGKYTLVKLLRRYGEATLPRVKIIDMSNEHRENNWTFLSRYLKTKIQETLNHKRQIILLLNRRGFSVFLICKSCGYIYKCRNCSVNLIYHHTTMTLMCHQCGYSEPVPDHCPKCGGEHIRYKGTGIQKVEKFLKIIFPDVRILRMDRDTTRRKGMHISILDIFARGEADILLGTQMVAKGLNFPGVRLVGVLQADIGLHFPDFRASERTFQLLAQVAGRAGRKDSLGEVVIQTYSPQEPGIDASKAHDFKGFFQEEIKARQVLGYPPFGRLARIIVQGKEETMVKSLIWKISKTIRQKRNDKINVLGPSPAVLARLKQAYRYSLLVKSKSPKILQNVLYKVRSRFRKIPGRLKIIIDVDPVNML